MSYSDDKAFVCAAFKNENITGYGRPVVAFGDPKILREQAEKLYQKCPNIWYLTFCRDGVDNFATYLLEQGLPHSAYLTQIIDLDKPVDELRSDCRKSYKSLINQQQKEYNIELHSSLTAAKFMKELYDLTKRVFPGSDRPESTWAAQMDMINEGEAFGACARQAGKMVAGALFLHNKDSCYYGVAKSEEGVGTHAIIWNSIVHAKGLKLKTLEMGQQYYGNSKLAQISLFKRGFGGQTKVMLEIGTKP